MKTVLTLLVLSFSFSINALAASPFKRINCQYTQNEKVLVQFQSGAAGQLALFKSASMTAPQQTNILSSYETPYELVLDGYMPANWPQGTTFRANLQKNSPFHDIVIDNPNGSFQRLTMTCDLKP